ncbi:MAG TPA: VPDSG-CTERM sorting domain-containing protein [Terrimicrobiaceae bacterium]
MPSSLAWRVLTFTVNMKKYLVCALVAVVFALNVEAKDKEKDKDKDYNGPVVSVPDSGSTLLLLGTGLAAIAIASRYRIQAR